AQAAGTPLGRSDLLRRAWPDAIDNLRTVDTHVLSLRKKIELDPRQPSLIQTVRNVGYRLNMEALGINGSKGTVDRAPPRKLEVRAATNAMPSEAHHSL
ncbi:MAG: helix-turn-helix domain-containing protein, partial [Cyanobacteriota bacterium SKYGB_h_bin112]|nr:helix-turn-helix domain-containing protein [Cyanobacteriota bacterium SKYGB_h_bin112]